MEHAVKVISACLVLIGRSQDLVVYYIRHCTTSQNASTPIFREPTYCVSGWATKDETLRGVVQGYLEVECVDSSGKRVFQTAWNRLSLVIWHIRRTVAE